MNETQIYYYDPMFKQRTSKCVPQGCFHTLKTCATKLKMKYKFITFFDWEGLVNTHCARWSNSKCRLVRWSPEAPYYSTNPVKWPHYCNHQWKLHHDNICLHVAHVLDFLTSHGVEVIPHTPYSPDLVLWIFMSPAGKRDLKGRHFEISTSDVRGCRNCF